MEVCGVGGGGGWRVEEIVDALKRICNDSRGEMIEGCWCVWPSIYRYLRCVSLSVCVYDDCMYA